MDFRQPEQPTIIDGNQPPIENIPTRDPNEEIF
jgi:hypothetical protein